jgi:hypothetical protein
MRDGLANAPPAVSRETAVAGSVGRDVADVEGGLQDANHTALEGGKVICGPGINQGNENESVRTQGAHETVDWGEGAGAGMHRAQVLVQTLTEVRSAADVKVLRERGEENVNTGSIEARGAILQIRPDALQPGLRGARKGIALEGGDARMVGSEERRARGARRMGRKGCGICRE